MKYVTYIVLLISIILVILIYKYNVNSTYNYLSIGDALSKYDEYVYEELNYKQKNMNKIIVSDTKKLIENIEYNIEINDKSIQNIIFNADMITLSVGINEISNDKLIENLETIFNLLRKYNVKDIYITNYYNINSDYINEQLKKLSNQYNITYIDINALFKQSNKYLYINNPYPDTNGYKLIAKKIINCKKNTNNC